eukprot:TRINITY_DN5437_c0_g1_i1.p1 TRINITY_DN5437_c0_g1~~TRINITY_DN5437_c0_g1_i1.p1  ORF type:complete len:265 (-),score=15.39 TRINITY_DN5437_c0_g1_i1:90-884(-)
MSILLSFIFAPPSSIYLNAMTVFTFLSLCYSAFSEVNGKPLQYSKFWNVNSKEGKKEMMISSLMGMLLLYMPAFLGAVSLLSVSADTGSRCLLVTWVLAIHFFKRILEVLFVHKYSGGMILNPAIRISFLCFSATVLMIYSQLLTPGTPDPPLDLKDIGIVLYVVGIIGNFYHHLILSKLREKDEKGYKIPKGGLFSLVVCPHYLFEIIEFIGVSFISQTEYSFSFTLGSIVYLMGRSYITRNWYLSKFPSFPREIKALIPYVF